MNIENMKDKLIYLAGPYTDDDEQVAYHRYWLLTKISSLLISDYAVPNFSPITQSYHQCQANDKLKGTWASWKDIDTVHITASDIVIVCMLPGWRESVGVTAEIKLAEKLDIPVYYLHFCEVWDDIILMNKPLRKGQSYEGV